MMLLVSLIILISARSIFVKEVDYQAIANDLNEKNMDKILNAVDGYAKIKNKTFIVTSILENQDEIKVNENESSFEGVYNTIGDNALGTGQVIFKSGLERKDAKEQIKEEESLEFPVNYSNNQYTNKETNEGLDLIFMIDKLQGIEKIVPISYGDEPDRSPRIYYDLSEQEFKEILNDDLKIEYDKFTKATIFIGLLEGKEGKLFIPEIFIGVEWEEKANNGRTIGYKMSNSTYFDDDNLKAKRKYKK